MEGDNIIPFPFEEEAAFKRAYVIQKEKEIGEQSLSVLLAVHRELSKPSITLDDVKTVRDNLGGFIASIKACRDEYYASEE